MIHIGEPLAAVFYNTSFRFLIDVHSKETDGQFYYLTISSSNSFAFPRRRISRPTHLATPMQTKLRARLVSANTLSCLLIVFEVIDGANEHHQPDVLSLLQILSDLRSMSAYQRFRQLLLEMTLPSFVFGGKLGLSI